MEIRARGLIVDQDGGSLWIPAHGSCLGDQNG